MTREEGVEICIEALSQHEDGSDSYFTLLDDLKRLKDVNSLEQILCNDAISREDVLDLCDSNDPDYAVKHLKEDVECLRPVRPTAKLG